MLQRMRVALCNQRGSGHAVSILFFLLIASVILYCAVDVYGYMTQKQKLSIATNELLEIIKSENGYGSTNRIQFDEFVRSQGLDPAKITIQATPKLVQRGATLELITEMNYTFVGLKPLGQEITIPITVRTSGLAHTFLR